MRKEVIYTLKSLYRDDMRIMAYTFGQGEKSVCIVGAMRGNEAQQLFVTSQMIRYLKEAEEQGNITDGKSITVIPSVNNYSLNIRERFWPVDNTDINRMYPGYDLGETTQRIAAGLFAYVKDYTYGIQLASYYQKGAFVPHIRMLNTGYQDTEDANLFGLPYVVEKKALPIDTGTLNYNWQIWNCHAFSLYTDETSRISTKSAGEGVEAMARFLNAMGILHCKVPEGKQSILIKDEQWIPVNSHQGGIYERAVSPGDYVKCGAIMARIYHPFEGDVIEEIHAPIGGVVFFAHRSQLVNAHEHLFDIIGE